MSQGLGGYHVVRFRFLPVEKTLGFFVEASRKVGGFDKGPDQVGITVLGVAFPLLLAIGTKKGTDLFMAPRRHFLKINLSPFPRVPFSADQPQSDTVDQ
ncbi:hypothetical protein [Ectopseudomonas composti]|uniref:hypothetical protein n=1 Tax=Ectopseudomonas composti TaxID=658457 RepID=UPI0012E35E36|nr:hypothetical protein [Pseudomonas composti]